MEYQRVEHHVHLIIYHPLWCPKRRRAVLVGPVAKDCRSVIEHKLEERGWSLLELAIEPDPVHLFVGAWPTSSAYEIIKACKGITSNVLRKQYPHLRRLPSLWTRSSFASTAGTVSAETIQRYIEAQKRA